MRTLEALQGHSNRNQSLRLLLLLIILGTFPCYALAIFYIGSAPLDSATPTLAATFTPIGAGLISPSAPTLPTHTPLSYLPPTYTPLSNLPPTPRQFIPPTAIPIRTTIAPTALSPSPLPSPTAGIADADGVLIAGTVIDTAQGAVTADGSDRFRITAAERSPELDGRTRLTPPGDLPQVVYLGGDETAYLDALERGEIVGFARGEIGNTDAASANDGRFVVTALDPQVERGGFALPIADEALRSCLNERIDWLTDHRTIGYPDWVNNPDIFLERAQLWNAAN